MPYVLIDPRNGPLGPPAPRDANVVDTLKGAQQFAKIRATYDYDPPKWWEVYDLAGWDGVSYGDLVGQVHTGPRNGPTFERS